jgi:hypothetical protein
MSRDLALARDLVRLRVGTCFDSDLAPTKESITCCGTWRGRNAIEGKSRDDARARHLHSYVHVCVYIACVCVCIHCAYIYIYIYIYIYALTNTYENTYFRSRTLHVCIKCIHTSMHTYTHTYDNNCYRTPN